LDFDFIRLANSSARWVQAALAVVVAGIAGLRHRFLFRLARGTALDGFSGGGGRVRLVGQGVAQALHPPGAEQLVRMIDAVDVYLPGGGSHALGFIRGIKAIDPDEWFFKAHFHQDPVCPGSLGIESFLQLIKFAALKRWGHLAQSHRFMPVFRR